MTNTAHFYFQSFEEWRHALTERCNIPLTPEYARARIEALENLQDQTTQEFSAKYGDDYRRQVVAWFQQAAES